MLPVALFAILKSKRYWQAGVASMIGGLLYFLLWQWIGAPFLPPEVVGTILAHPLKILFTNFTISNGKIC